MPRTKKKRGQFPDLKMPKGFYLKKGFWYKRIWKPDPTTGCWRLLPEATRCREADREEAIECIARREAELVKSRRAGSLIDPGKVTMDELFDDLLQNTPHEATRKNDEFVIDAHLRPFFGKMLAKEVTVKDCQGFRALRRQQGIKDTIVNRDLSKVSKAFRIAFKLGKVHHLPPGGCDFHKRPETENTRRVRLPDRYFGFFRDALHPALKCLFIVGYKTGRRLSELLNLRWDRVDFEEKCTYFEATKFGSGKAPFRGEMECALRHQKLRRDKEHPECPFVFFWFDYRAAKDGEQIRRFDGLWSAAVKALAGRLRSDGEEPIDLHFHDLRRSAHFQMRKAGIDGQTRRDIMGHETTSMDDRYTMIDDEALEEARRKMDLFQRSRGLMADDSESRIELLKAEIRRLEELRTGGKTPL